MPRVRQYRPRRSKLFDRDPAPRRGSGKRVWIARDEHDVGASLRRRKRNRPAEAPASPGDEDAFAVEPELVEHRHVEDPSRFCRVFF
jgi:hypothetical protein